MMTVRNRVNMRAVYFILSLLLISCSKDDASETLGKFELQSISIGEKQDQSSFENVAPNASIVLTFTDAVDEATIQSNIILKLNDQAVAYDSKLQGKDKLSLTPIGGFKSFSSYKLVINPGVKSTSGVSLTNGKVYEIRTGMDDSDKFDRIPDEDLLTLVQKQTFKYFWNFGHAHSGMARERTTSGDVVTTGGTGFGVMAMLVAAERGFVTRQEALERVQKIVTFLDKECTSYHGAYAHWINGATGETKPFGDKDDGADLVETSLLFQGLLAARAYFKDGSEAESKLRSDITRLWEAIEWTWFQKGGESVLYWHWSPNYGFEKNLPIRGWNECLITYVLAASSPTYPIDKAVYEAGWARNGGLKNGNTYYGENLKVGVSKGGPLFFIHYSYLGLDPHKFTDKYTNYFENNQKMAKINQRYCIENQGGYVGYGEDCWGLTASDFAWNYQAQEPMPHRDNGTMAPTGALASFPYTPGASMKALRNYYRNYGSFLWGEYGFRDAFNLTVNWVSPLFMGLNQAPVTVMIENYRTNLLWNLFMSHPDVQKGIQKIQSIK